MTKVRHYLFFVIFLWSCTSNDQDTRTYIELDYPNYFPEAKSSVKNPLTKEGVALGEKLFFDPILSENEKVSCATCHNPDLSFSDGLPVSNLGVSGKKMMRNSPVLINLAWMERLFWDGGVHNLESLPFAALTNPDEMGTDLFLVSEKLNQNKTYKALFKSAFGIDSIASAYIARALAQYQRTLIFSNAKYDKFKVGKSELSDEEQKGFSIFKDKCRSCHIPPLFTDNDYHNNGLDTLFSSRNLDILKGRFRITRDSIDMGKYKTPTLRNLKYTAPYMHDGRFATLEEVLNHYQANILESPTLDSVLIKFSLSNAEKESILIFLEALNDENLNSKRNQMSKN